MEHSNGRRLTFPQRNWLLLCLLTACLTVLIYYLIDKHHSNPESQYNGMPATQSPGSLSDTAQAQGIPPDSLKH